MSNAITPKDDGYQAYVGRDNRVFSTRKPLSKSDFRINSYIRESIAGPGTFNSYDQTPHKGYRARLRPLVEVSLRGS